MRRAARRNSALFNHEDRCCFPAALTLRCLDKPACGLFYAGYPGCKELPGGGGPRRQRVLDQRVKHLPAGSGLGLHGHPLR